MSYALIPRIIEGLMGGGGGGGGGGTGCAAVVLRVGPEEEAGEATGGAAVGDEGPVLGLFVSLCGSSGVAGGSAGGTDSILSEASAAGAVAEEKTSGSGSSGGSSSGDSTEVVWVSPRQLASTGSGGGEGGRCYSYLVECTTRSAPTWERKTATGRFHVEDLDQAGRAGGAGGDGEESDEESDEFDGPDL